MAKPTFCVRAAAACDTPSRNSPDTGQRYDGAYPPKQLHFHWIGEGAKPSLLLSDHTSGAANTFRYRLNQPVAVAPVATITYSAWQAIRRFWSNHVESLKECITETDLLIHAHSHGLPVAYVKFYTGAVSNANRDGGEACVSVEAFDAFVKSREVALQRAFKLFDRDQDGKISAEDLDASLAHIQVCCPKSRCVYKCKRNMTDELFKKAAARRSSTVDFNDFRDFFMLLPQTDMLVEYWHKADQLPDLDTKFIMRDAGMKGSPWGHLFAGAVAGAASRTATAPLETLRLAAMAGTLQTDNLVHAAANMVEQHGWQSLYRGNFVNVLRSAPQKALDFFIFDGLKRVFGSDSSIKTFAAAGLAGVCTWVGLYPLEVVRSRVTCGALNLRDFKHIGHCVTTIARQEGVGALYKGLGPSVAAIFPEAAITYGLHDYLKSLHKKVLHHDPGLPTSLAFGVFSAFMGQLVAFPLETVSRRLQVMQGGTGPGAVWTVLQDLLHQGGPAALYRGLGAATLRLVPMAAVSFGTYELVRSLLLYMEQHQDEQEAEQEYSRIHKFTTPLSAASLASNSSSSCNLVSQSSSSPSYSYAGSNTSSLPCSDTAASTCSKEAVVASILTGHKAPNCSAGPSSASLSQSHTVLTPSLQPQPVPAAVAGGTAQDGARPP